MSETEIEIGELIIHEHLGPDPFGMSYRGVDKSTGSPILLICSPAPEERSLTTDVILERLQKTSLPESEFIAPIIDAGKINPDLNSSLNALLSSRLDQPFSFDFYVAYRITGGASLGHRESGLSSEKSRQVFLQLLNALKVIHKKRIYHLALHPNSVWLHNDSLFLTHTGLAAAFKSRGLSLSKEQEALTPHLEARRIFASPEELKGKLTNQTSDLFAASIIMHILMTAEVPEREAETGEGYPSPRFNASWRELFTRGLTSEVRNRFPTSDMFEKALLPLMDQEPLSEQERSIVIERETRGEESGVSLENLIIDAYEDDAHPIMDQTFNEASEDENDYINLINEETELNTPSPATNTLILGGDQGKDPNSDQTSDSIPELALDSASKSIPSSALEANSELNSEPQGDTSSVRLDSSKPERADASTQSEVDADAQRATSLSEAKEPTASRIESEVEPAQESTSQPDANPSKTLAFFSGSDEASTDDFQSLRSQLAESSGRPKPKIGSASNVGELSFGVSDDDLGFNQEQSDERTFLEFSDEGDQTVFEEDLDAAVHHSHKTLVGQPAISTGLSGQNQPSAPIKTQAFFSSDLPSTPLPAYPDGLQSPDFLEDFSDSLDPSRVLPIPNKRGASPHSQAEAVFRGHTPQDALNSPSPAPQQTVTPPPSTPNASPARPVKPRRSTGGGVSLQSGDAMDWPGSQAASSYTPPSPPPVNQAQIRQTPKLKKKSSSGRKLITTLIVLLMVGGGGFGIYWGGSNAGRISQITTGIIRQLTSLVGGSKPTSLNVTTSPSDMTVWLDQTPSKEQPPFVFLFKPKHEVGGSINARFIWKTKSRRSMVSTQHSDTLPILAGDTSLYFQAGTLGAQYSRSLIKTSGVSAQVILADQLIGHTPLLIIGTKDSTLELTLQAPSIEKELKLTLGSKDQEELEINMSPSPSEDAVN